MGKSTTEQVNTSNTKRIIDAVGREFFALYCEDNDVLKESMDDLLALARGTDKEKTRVEIRKFLIEQLIGKPKQAVDMDVVNGIEIKFTREIMDEEANTPKV